MGYTARSVVDYENKEIFLQNQLLTAPFGLGLCNSREKEEF